ncbi:MAG: enoyl-CoA hydratase/isomerase family protein [Spongiibacteraceae bacterium]|nr:enoyl-CoA hydratase/isomerase family protein [Spongiibacteraceae bacterium]
MSRMVNVSFSGPLAQLVIQSEDGINALNLDRVLSIQRAVDQVSEKPVTRVLLIRAEGKAFCVGGDIHYLQKNNQRLPETLDDLLIPWQQTLVKLSQLPLGVIVAVDGIVSGGGLGLLLTADYVLASSRSGFVSGFGQLGLSCDSGISWMLPRLIGSLRAKAVLLDQQFLDAQTACQWGLINAVVDDKDINHSAQRKALDMCAYSQSALRAVKQLLQHSFSNDYVSQLELERETIKSCAVKPDAKEGLHAFVSRRSPCFNQESK